jgi:hypothetical protein
MSLNRTGLGVTPIFINLQKHDVGEESLTARELLALAGLGEGYDLFLLQGEGDLEGVCVLADDSVPIKPGMHFRTIPGNCTFGAEEDPPPLVRQDVSRLAEALGLEVGVEADGQQVLIVVKQAPLPIHSRERSDVLMITDRSYPGSAMDMFWLEEGIRLRDGSVPGYASSIETHAGRRWRRWSWHRNGRWTPGADDLLSHWAFIEGCWAKEAEGAAAGVR